MPVDVPAYDDFLPAALREALLADTEPVDAVPGFRVAAGLRAAFPATETDRALAVIAEVYRRTRTSLARVLDQRRVDRAFVDAHTRSFVDHNAALDFRDPAYATVIGLRDEAGRVVVGPTTAPRPTPHAEVPTVLRGDQVTLFGPPGNARMCVHAMNALHRRRPDEPPIVTSLVEASGMVPRWGADDEDSRTPIMSSFLQAAENLSGCYEGTLSAGDLRLTEQGRALPIKRIPGLALPDGSHWLDGEPLPLHLVDLVLHVWRQRHRPEALVLYVPKLENEEEAGYLRELLSATEAVVGEADPTYVPGAIRVLLVFENPRAIFRIREMGAVLGTYFLGGSLGWHDFLGSTARLFREDPRYRIPVKADPNIVITRIQASHRLLVDELRGTGAMTIGGMYGVLFEDGNPDSFAVSMVGFVRDVTTQLERGLTGYWVAHPDFVRIGIALVQAWRRREQDPDDGALVELITALVPDPVEREPLLRFVLGPDVKGLAPDDPLWPRSVLAADLETSPVIANDHPDEVRYNVFQALQYLADWLCGNGCVALPATMTNARGEKVFVRIMDDLATTERSRWELWAEVRHRRVPVATFEAILAEEVERIREGRDTPTKRVQVRWEGEAARWYPVAVELLRRLVLAEEPPEFVTQWTLAFTFPAVRDAADPWARAAELCPALS